MSNVINHIVVELGLFTSELVIKGDIGNQVTILKENDIIYDETISASNPSPIRLKVKGNSNYTVKINKSGKITTETIFIPLNHEQFLEYYKVFFDLNGGLVVSGETDQRIAVHENGIPPTCKRDGYTSYSWDGSYNDITSDRVIQAIWTSTYNVTFDFTGGHDANGKSSVTYKVNSGTNSPVPPTPYTAPLASQEFDRWSGDYTNVTNDRTITALWKTKTFRIRFDARNGRFSNGSQYYYDTVNYGGTASAPDPSWEGHRFTGWDVSLTNVTSQIIPWAEWEAITFEIRFDARGGRFPSGSQYYYDTVEYGGTASAPNPSRDGYDFTGWDVSLTNVTSEIIPWAEWSAWNGWHGGDTYYIDGQYQTGWFTVGSYQYYGGSNGVCYRGWHTIDGRKYYFHLTGYNAMSGWQRIDGESYYFHLTGYYAMKGWQKIGGKSYYFYDDYHMARSEYTPDGYWVDENGVWNG